MTRQTDPGIIESTNLKDGRVRYNVRLPDGTVLVVSRRLIVPEPAKELPAGTRLLVEHSGASVIGALMADRTSRQTLDPVSVRPPQPQQETYHAHVVAADQTSGNLTLAWGEGEELSATVSPGRRIWEHLRPGTEILVARSANSAGKVTYRLRLPPGAPGEQPPAVVGRHAHMAHEEPPPAQHLVPPPVDPFDQMSGPPPAAEPDLALDRPIACPEMGPIFGDGGPVNRLLGERYSPRPGQIQMAEQIGTLLQTPGHAVIEAGTGIGKSFAYLVPIIWSGANAIVSTSNKALMSQLWRKDLPALAKIAPRPFKAALLKGRSNYLCVRRLEELPRNRHLPGMGGDLETIEAGLRRAPSGDCEEMGLSQSLTRRFTVDHRACEGIKCPRYADCFTSAPRPSPRGRTSSSPIMRCSVSACCATTTSCCLFAPCSSSTKRTSWKPTRSTP